MISVEKSGRQKKTKQDIILLSGCQLINNLKFLKARKDNHFYNVLQVLFKTGKNKLYLAGYTPIHAFTSSGVGFFSSSLFFLLKPQSSW